MYRLQNVCKSYPEAFSVENNLAVVNYAKGLDEALLLQAADKCPTNAIHPDFKENG